MQDRMTSVVAVAVSAGVAGAAVGGGGGEMIDLHKDAHALRCVRIVKGEFRYYEAVTFPNGAYRGCELYLRRLAGCGHLTTPDSEYAIVDVLDQDGDIVQDFAITRKGFEYLRQKLKFRIERGYHQ